MAATLSAGDPAPDFTRPTANGEEISLRQFRGRRAVVLYFYPRDNTAVCTAQACAFRDHIEDFRSADAEVIGVSVNSLDSHRQFAARHRLPFHLLSDADGSLRALYGVEDALWVIPARVTFVIDKQGIIRHVFSARFQSSQHVERALAALAAAAPNPQAHPPPRASSPAAPPERAGGSA